MKKVNAKKLKELAASFERMKAEQTKAAQLLREACPVGSEVCYAHGDRLRFVEVVRHLEHNHLEVIVRGVTGAEYRVSAWSILREMVEGFTGF
jgi:hypothetical protein